VPAGVLTGDLALGSAMTDVNFILTASAREVLLFLA
jgi:hypothetical protein